MKKTTNKLKNRFNSESYAMGGTVGAGGAGGGWTSLAQNAPQLMEGLMSLLDGNATKPMTQPIVNAATIKNMSNPYSHFAMGGEAGDIGQEQMAQLEALAEQYGISVEELMQLMADGAANGETENQEMFPVQEEEPSEEEQFDDGEAQAIEQAPLLESEVGEQPEEEGGSRVMDFISDSNSQYGFAYGGRAGTGGRRNINVENNEILETPGGLITKAKGKTHEKGGIDVNVPTGTLIFSDRLSLDGKTMQQRKLTREKKLNRFEKLLERTPHDRLLKKTYERTQNNTKMEENGDLRLQEVANLMYSKRGKDNPKFAGGTDPYGIDPLIGDADINSQFYMDNTNLPIDRRILNAPVSLRNSRGLAMNPYTKGYAMVDPPNDNTRQGLSMESAMSTSLSSSPTLSNNIRKKADPALIKSNQTPNNGYRMTTGDYVGLAGTAFNSIAPMVNTIMQRRTDKPNINRFKAFGKDAIQANEDAQDFAGGLRTTALTDIDTSAGSQRFRNRDSANSVNTQRALDIATTMGSDRAKLGANNAFAQQMIGLLGQRSQLTNVRDSAVMKGETMRDMEDKADKDAFFTAAASNITNMGNSVQAAGRNLNTAKGNQMDRQLLSQLSKYGLTFDENGNLISK